MVYEDEGKDHRRDIMDINDIIQKIQVMRNQEETTYARVDYLKQKRHQATRRDVSSIDKLCRSKMCDWSYQVAEFCQFDKHTVDIAMSYLDRFISSDHPRAKTAFNDRKEFQLAAMTTLYIAVKLFEPCVLDLDIMSSLGHLTYFPEDFSKMELDILSGLKWNLNGPTSSNFIHHFLALLPLRGTTKNAVHEKLLESATLQTISATKDYNLSLQLPSTTAVCAILNAMNCVEYEHFSRKERKDYVMCLEYAAGIDLQKFCFIETKYILSMSFKTSSFTGMEAFTLKSNECEIDHSTKTSNESKYHSDPDQVSSPICISSERSLSSSSRNIVYEISNLAS